MSLINKENLIARIREEYHPEDNEETETEQIINEQDVVDAVEVVHAHWNYNLKGVEWGYDAWECSKCGGKNFNISCNKSVNPLMFSGSKYCPNCGAKMDESVSE